MLNSLIFLLGASPTQQHNANSTVPHANHASNKRKVTVDDVFNIKDEEAEAKKKRKLILLDDNQEEGRKTPNSVSQMTMEEKRKHIKNLIEKIPTDKNELFAYNLDWSVVDKVRTKNSLNLLHVSEMPTSTDYP